MNINNLEKEKFSMCETPWVVSIKTQIEVDSGLDVTINDLNDLEFNKFDLDKIRIVT